MRSDVVVYLRGGRYELRNPFVLNATDSGENGFNVIWQSYPRETAILSGGKMVTGWINDGPWWRAFVGKATQSRQLYVNGIRAVRARTAAGRLRKVAKNAAGYVVPGLNMAGWQDLSDVEIVARQKWRLYRCGVDGADGAAIIVKQPCWNLSRLAHAAPIGAPSWIENALELLDTPGEWYLNRTTGWLYYKPRVGEVMGSARVVLPLLEELVTVSGSPAAAVHNIAFRGITFADVTWRGPDGPAGFSEILASVLATGEPGQKGNRLMPGNVSFDFARAITLDHDVFTRLGAAGLAFHHVTDATVSDSDFHDISGTGIQVGDIDGPKNDDPRFVTRGVTLHDNLINDVAVEYEGCVGIWLGYVQDSVVRNNDVGRLPYTAISIGWGHGTVDPTVSRNNLVKANHIHDYMRVLNDGGGVYSLSAQPGNLYTENLIERGAHANGIYLDDGSRYIEVSRNIVVGNQRTALIKGRDNSIHDNWWQMRTPRDVTLFRQKLCLVPSCMMNALQDNHVIDGPAQAPRSLLGAAGAQASPAAVPSGTD